MSLGVDSVLEHRLMGVWACGQDGVTDSPFVRAAVVVCAKGGGRLSWLASRCVGRQGLAYNNLLVDPACVVKK